MKGQLSFVVASKVIQKRKPLVVAFQQRRAGHFER